MSTAAPPASRGATTGFALRYLAVGAYLGIVLTKSEAISWYRIQEMFRFDSFHMYGLMASAVAVGMGSLWLIRRWRLRTVAGEAIVVPPKDLGRWRGALFGGTIFGLGWALAGACPGPIAALIGAGEWGYAVVLLGAMAGTMLYGALRQRLPQ